MVSSGLLRRVALVRTDISEEPGDSFIRVTKIGELGTTQAATSNRRMLRRNTTWYFFIVTAVKTSNLAIVFIYLWGWNGTKPTITAAIYWPLVPDLDHRW
jgi:hypothetical protein